MVDFLPEGDFSLPLRALSTFLDKPFASSIKTFFSPVLPKKYTLCLSGLGTVGRGFSTNGIVPFSV